MRPVETIPGMGLIKENDGGGKFNYKNFCKCLSVPQVQQ
jgi:hypothetical protein